MHVTNGFPYEIRISKLLHINLWSVACNKPMCVCSVLTMYFILDADCRLPTHTLIRSNERNIVAYTPYSHWIVICLINSVLYYSNCVLCSIWTRLSWRRHQSDNIVSTVLFKNFKQTKTTTAGKKNRTELQQQQHLKMLGVRCCEIKIIIAVNVFNALLRVFPCIFVELL